MSEKSMDEKTVERITKISSGITKNRLTGVRLYSAPILFLVVLIGILSPALAQEDGRTDPLTITAVIPRHFPPHYIVDKGGKPVGFAIDVMKEIAARAELRVTYLVVDSWTAVEEEIRGGRADLIPNIGITAERKTWLDYTAPVETFAVSIFVREETLDINSVDDLPGRKVAAVEFNVAVNLLQNRQGIDLKVFSRASDAVFELLSGHVDALVYPQPVLMKMLRETGIYHRLKVVGKPLVEIKRAIAVRKGNAELLGRLDQTVHRFVASPEYQQIYVKWFGKPRPFWTASRVLSSMIALVLIVFLAMAAWRYHSIVKLNRNLSSSIAEREKAQEALIRSEQRYRTMFESMSNCVAVYEAVNGGSDFIFRDFNRAAERVEGMRRENLIDKSVLRAFPAVKDFGLFEVFKRVWATGEPEYHPVTLYKDERIAGWRENFVYKLPSGDIVAVYSDETERKQAEEEHERLRSQLAQAQRMEAIGTLAGGIAHDFNNILSAIIGYTQLVLEDVPERSRTRANLKEVYKAGTRAKDLVGQILAFSRQREHEQKPVRIPDVVKEALGLLRPSLPTTIEIRQNIQTESDTVLADPTQIHQVLMNLCTNAAHAMREKGGILELTLEDVDLDSHDVVSYPDLTPGAYVRLSVSDTGHGMNRRVMKRIFDPYFTTKEKGVGTGLGLAVVDGIVKSHGGAITAYSELEKGTTFHVCLPRIEHSDASVEAEEIEPLPKGHECILFVDDEKPLVDIAKQMLERLGYQVTARTSSIEALEAFRAQPKKFDLVITDQTMPAMTGKMLAKEIIGIKPDIPVILCSGYSEILSGEKSGALGIRDVLRKPVINRELAQTIRRVLDKSNRD